MANPVYIKFTGRLKSTAQEGILAEAQQVQDVSLNKNQQAINAELYSKVNAVGSQINTAVAGVYKYKESVASLSEIYALTCSVGDVFNVTNDFTFEGKTYKAGTNVAVKTGFRAGVGTEANLDPLGGITDLSQYYTKTEVNTKLATKVDQTTYATDKATLEANTAKKGIVLESKKVGFETYDPFTTEDATSETLAGYFNGTNAPTFDALFSAIQAGVTVSRKFRENSLGMFDNSGVMNCSKAYAYDCKEYNSSDTSKYTSSKRIELEIGSIGVLITKASDGTLSSTIGPSDLQRERNRITALEKLLTLA
uniref:hypothetical protein n=1 Tax=Alloprevotella sp. TaxID=1872471 RepID=UPI004028C2C3